MIMIDGKKFVGVTTVFDKHDPPVYLVTYTIDGEPSAPLYTEHGATGEDLKQYLSNVEEGKIQNLKFWRLDARAYSSFYPFLTQYM